MTAAWDRFWGKVFIGDPELRTRGERHGQTKLTDEQVAGVRQAARFGRRHREIAEKYGVSRSHVSGIISGTKRTYV